MQNHGGAMVVYGRDDVLFNGNANYMIGNTAGTVGKNIVYHGSNSIQFSVCVPGTTSPGPLIGNLEVDFGVCDNGQGLDLCSWHQKLSRYFVGTMLVPAAGCKMSQRQIVRGDLTITSNRDGESGSYHELQANRVDDQTVAVSDRHRHFNLYSPGKLTLNDLKLTWGQTDGYGGFIYMISGTLAINWVHFDGSKTTGQHAGSGGCMRVHGGGVTIRESTFEGFMASQGGAMFVNGGHAAIESTTFIDNEATVRFILINLYFFRRFCFDISLFFFLCIKIQEINLYTNKNISFHFFLLFFFEIFFYFAFLLH